MLQGWEKKGGGGVQGGGMSHQLRAARNLYSDVGENNLPSSFFPSPFPDGVVTVVIAVVVAVVVAVVIVVVVVAVAIVVMRRGTKFSHLFSD